MILVGAIISIGVVNFISDSARGLESASRRSRLAAAGQVAIQRLSFELHNALPNSLRVTTPEAGGDQCIEFIPIRAATNYVDPGFSGSGKISFDVVDFVPDQQGTTGGYAVIYPRQINRVYDGDNGAVYADWPNFPNNSPIQEIDTITDSGAADQSTITLVQSHRFRRRSPVQRLFVVDQPISYCISGSNLYRYTDYGFFTSQVTQEEEPGTCEVSPDPPDRCLPDYDAIPTRSKTLIIDSIDNTGLTAFSVESQSLRRNSLVRIEFNLTTGTESIQVNHEVLSRNVP